MGKSSGSTRRSSSANPTGVGAAQNAAPAAEATQNAPASAPSINPGSENEMVYNPQTGEFEYTSNDAMTIDHAEHVNRVLDDIQPNFTRADSKLVEDVMSTVESTMQTIRTEAGKIKTVADLREWTRYVENSRASLYRNIDERMHLLLHNAGFETGRRKATMTSARMELMSLKWDIDHTFQQLGISQQIQDLEGALIRANRWS